MKLRPFFRQVQQLPRWLLAGLVTVLGLLIGLGALAYVNVEHQVEATHLVGHTYQVVESLQKIRSTMQEVDNNQRSYVVSGTDAYLQAFQASAASLPALLATTGGLIADNPMQGARLRRVHGLIDERLELARTRIGQRQQLGVEALGPKFISIAAAQLMESIRTGIDAMTSSENLLLEGRLHTLERARVRGLVLQTVGGVLSIGLLLAVFAGAGDCRSCAPTARRRRSAAATPNSRTPTTNCARSHTPSRTTCARRCGPSTGSRRCWSRIASRS